MILRADARWLPLKDGVVNCVVTSPPYWALRDYGVAPSAWGGEPSCEHAWEETERHEAYTGKTRWQHTTKGRGEEQPDEKRLRTSTTRETRPEAWGALAQGAFCTKRGAWKGVLGLEPSPDLYVEHLIQIFREVRRVLRDDGTLWLNLGDCYHSGDRGGYRLDSHRWEGSEIQSGYRDRGGSGIPLAPNRLPQAGLKDKDLVGIPWRVAFALQAEGWWLRSDIVWSKPNPMPESITDRPTKSHEYVFLLAKSKIYYYDAEAIKEPWSSDREDMARLGAPRSGAAYLSQAKVPDNSSKQDAVCKRTYKGFNSRWKVNPPTSMARNKRTVWTIPTQPYSGAHFATFAEKLVRLCILAGCPPGGFVLDPFAGSGTVGKVAIEEGRVPVLCDLAYQALAIARLRNVQMKLSS